MDVYGFCDAHCRYPVYTKEQVTSILQQLIDSGSLAGVDPSLNPIVALIQESKSKKNLSFWVGTEAEYNEINPAPAASIVIARIDGDGKIYLCTDDTTMQSWQTYVLQQAAIIAQDTINARVDEIAVTKQEQHTAAVVTLAAADWSSNMQLAIVSGVTVTNTVIVSPAPAAVEAYGAAKIKCTAQGVNRLIFECDSVPDSDLTVNVIILGV